MSLPSPSSEYGIPSSTIRFDCFEADLRAGELRKDGIKVRLQERPFKLLTVLLRNAGQVVTREDLRQELLPPNTFVDFDASLATAVRKLRDALNDSAEHPKYVETVGRRGYRFLVQVTTPESAAPSPAETPVLLEKSRPILAGTEAPVLMQARTPAQAIRRGWWLRWAIIASLPLLVLVSYYFTSLRNQGSLQPPPRRKSIAVLGFKNMTGNPSAQWLSTGLSEMLSTELSVGGRLHLIAGEDVARTKTDLHLPEAEALSADNLGALKKTLGVDLIAFGSYTVLPGDQDQSIRFDLRVQDVTTGDMIATLAETGQVTHLFDLVANSGSDLRRRLKVAQVGETEAESVLAELPSNSEGERLYAEGVDKLRMFDAPAARDLLVQAVAADPKNAASHVALADAWMALGYEGKAAEEAKIALGLSGNLPREQQLEIQGHAYETTYQWDKAADAYRTLFQFFPDNLEYGFALVRAQEKAGHSTEALTTITQLQKLHTSLIEEIRLELLTGTAYGDLGQQNKLQMVAADAEAKAANAGDTRLLQAQALRQEAAAWERLGELDKCKEKALEAVRLFNAAGDRSAGASTLLLAADELYDKGDYDGARSVASATIPIFQEVGARKGLRMAYERIGNGYFEQGRLAAAKQQYELALKIDQERDDAGDLASDYGNIANALDGMSDINGALKMNQLALNMFSRVGDQRGASATLYNVGLLMQEMGTLENAKQNYQESLKLAQQGGFRRGEFYPISGLADVELAGGDLDGARQKYEQIVSTCEELKEANFAAQARVSLAFVDLEQKRYSDGEALARLAVAEFDKEKVTQENAWAHAILARNLLGQGKLEEARKRADEAVRLSLQSPVRSPRFEATLASARIKAKAGDYAGASEQLRTMLAAAERLRYRPYQFQARLALAEVEVHTLGAAEARTRLTALEKDARTAGYLLVASDVHALAQDH